MGREPRQDDKEPEMATATETDIDERQVLLDDIRRAAESGATEGRLLRTREVALLFQVSERAVTDWATKGRIPSIRTPGGHRRYPAAEVFALLEESSG